MKSLVLLLVSAALAVAQAIPGRYLVVLKSEPTAAISIQKQVPYSASDQDVIARQAQIQTEHAAIATAIQSAGGAVTDHFDTLSNGIGANLMEKAVGQLRRDPRVQGVFPVMRHHILMAQLLPSQYHGFLLVSGTAGESTLRIPYWRAGQQRAKPAGAL